MSWLRLGSIGVAALLVAAVAGSVTAALRRERPAHVHVVEEVQPGALTDLAVAVDLELSAEQRAEIETLRSAAAPRVERLRAALDATEEALSRAELAQPFDEATVAGWVTRRAELSAYLRGTESRLVGLIVQVLTPDQRARFTELRSARSAEHALACAT